MHEISGAGAFFYPHPLPPLPRAGEKDYGVRKRSFHPTLKTDALPCAPTPLSHTVGEGLGVRGLPLASAQSE